MKTFLVACVAALVIATGGALLLSLVQQSSESAYSTTGARV